MNYHTAGPSGYDASPSQVTSHYFLPQQFPSIHLHVKLYIPQSWVEMEMLSVYYSGGGGGTRFPPSVLPSTLDKIFYTLFSHLP